MQKILTATIEQIAGISVFVFPESGPPIIIAEFSCIR